MPFNINSPHPVNKAQESNNIRATARKYQMDPKNIRRWMKNKSILAAMKPLKRARRSRKEFYPELESDLQKWIKNQCKDGKQVTTVSIRIKFQE